MSHAPPASIVDPRFAARSSSSSSSASPLALPSASSLLRGKATAGDQWSSSRSPKEHASFGHVDQDQGDWEGGEGGDGDESPYGSPSTSPRPYPYGDAADADYYSSSNAGAGLKRGLAKMTGKIAGGSPSLALDLSKVSYISSFNLLSIFSNLIFVILYFR